MVLFIFVSLSFIENLSSSKNQEKISYKKTFLLLKKWFFPKTIFCCFERLHPLIISQVLANSILLSENMSEIACKGCSKILKTTSILKHISHTSCKSVYSVEELSNLRNHLKRGNLKIERKSMIHLKEQKNKERKL